MFDELITGVDMARGVRVILIVAMALIVAVTFTRIAFNWRKLVSSQKLFLTGNLCITGYAMDALRAGIAAGLGLSPRLVLALIGCALLFLWALQPERMMEPSLQGEDPLGPREDLDGRPDVT